jgi:hypothetical protein
MSCFGGGDAYSHGSIYYCSCRWYAPSPSLSSVLLLLFSVSLISAPSVALTTYSKRDLLNMTMPLACQLSTHNIS